MAFTSSFIITFREALEISLIVGIILSYLHRTKQTRYNNVVYLGITAGIVASVIGAVIFNNIATDFTGATEEIFEGITMLIGAALLTSMIFWMMRQKHIAQHLREKVERHTQAANAYGLFFFVLIVVLREGIETVIFLSAAHLVSANNTLTGALAGITAAIILGYLLFVSAMKINVKRFFSTTSILLILFSAGLIANGVHELQEAAVLPTVVEHIWDTNHVINEKGGVGEILKGLFGYNANPSLIEVIMYIMYLCFVWYIWQRFKAKAQTNYQTQG
jgi:high-affinity iron transporter